MDKLGNKCIIIGFGITITIFVIAQVFMTNALTNYTLGTIGKNDLQNIMNISLYFTILPMGLMVIGMILIMYHASKDDNAFLLAVEAHLTDQ
jgi:hypothetical protein